MRGSFDRENLNKLLKEFYTAIGIRIAIFDDEYNLVVEYPEKAPSFCQRIRTTAEGRLACAKCDRDACIRAKKMKEPHVYTCHAGLTEAITPIEMTDGVAGYAILAHMLPKENIASALDIIHDRCQQYGIDVEKALQDARQIVPRSREQIMACLKVLDALSSYVYLKNLVRWKNDDICEDIGGYIDENLCSDLNNETLCEKYHCSRTTLYNISMSLFGMGIMKYIAYKRIKLAKKLLKEGKTVSETADLCGIPDYNYFCKIFKQHVGCSPSKYRKNPSD